MMLLIFRQSFRLNQCKRGLEKDGHQKPLISGKQRTQANELQKKKSRGFLLSTLLSEPGYYLAEWALFKVQVALDGQTMNTDAL